MVELCDLLHDGVALCREAEVGRGELALLSRHLPLHHRHLLFDVVELLARCGLVGYEGGKACAFVAEVVPLLPQRRHLSIGVEAAGVGGTDVGAQLAALEGEERTVDGAHHAAGGERLPLFDIEGEEFAGLAGRDGHFGGFEDARGIGLRGIVTASGEEQQGREEERLIHD